MLEHIGRFYTCNFFKTKEGAVYISWAEPYNGLRETNESMTYLFGGENSREERTLETFISALREACSDPKDRVIKAAREFCNSRAALTTPEGKALVAALEALP